MKYLITAVLLLFSLSAAPQGAGKAKAATCVACHGDKGISPNPLWPNLAGQKKEYMIKQMLDFKEDRRRDPLMSPMAKTLSAQDMQDLAEYYSNLNR